MTVFYLPKYSPFLNMVELAFSALKARVKNVLAEPGTRQRVNDRQAAHNAGLNLQQYRSNILQEIIENRLQQEITQDMCYNWDARSMTYIPRCIRFEDILFRIFFLFSCSILIMVSLNKFL